MTSPGLVFLITFAAVLIGMAGGSYLRTRLPDGHLNPNTKEVIRLGSGLLGTLAALVLGLLVASSKNAYDTQAGNVRQLTAGVILIDEMLMQYGQDSRDSRDSQNTREMRGVLRQSLDKLANAVWRQEATQIPAVTPFAASTAAERFYIAIEALTPTTDIQRVLKPRILDAATELARARLLIFAQIDTPVPWPFLMILILWLTVIFTSFSLFVEANPIVVTALLIFALSVSSALFLIMDLGQPFTGLMQIPGAPLRHALMPLGGS